MRKVLILILMVSLLPSVIYAAGIDNLAITKIARYLGAHWDADLTIGKDSVSIFYDTASGDSVVIVYTLFGYPVSRSYGKHLTSITTVNTDTTDTIAVHLPEPALLHFVAYTYDAGAVIDADSVTLYFENDYGGLPHIMTAFPNNDTLLDDIWCGDALWAPIREMSGALSRARLDSLYQVRGAKFTRYWHGYTQLLEAGGYGVGFFKGCIDSAFRAYDIGDKIIEFWDSTYVNENDGISANETDITVDNSGIFALAGPGSDHECWAIIGNYLTPNWEAIKVLSISNDTLTVERGKLGTSKKAFDDNDRIRACATSDACGPASFAELVIYLAVDDSRDTILDSALDWPKLYSQLVYDWLTGTSVHITGANDTNRTVDGYMNDLWIDDHGPCDHQDRTTFDTLANYFRGTVDTSETIRLIGNLNGEWGENIWAGNCGNMNGGGFTESNYWKDARRYPASDFTRDELVGKAFEAPVVHKQMWFDHIGTYRTPWHSHYINDQSKADPEGWRRYFRLHTAIAAIRDGMVSTKQYLKTKGEISGACWLDEWAIVDSTYTASPYDTNDATRHWLGEPIEEPVLIYDGWDDDEMSYVINSDFEGASGVSYWTGTGDIGTLARTSTSAYAGTYSLQAVIDATTNDNYNAAKIVGNMISLDAATDYTVRFYSRSDSTRWWQPYVRDGAGVTIRKHVATGSLRGVWREHVMTFDTDDYSVGDTALWNPTIEFWVGRKWDQPGDTLWFDDIDIKAGGYWVGIKRRFENGAVYINQSPDEHKIDLPDSFYNINGIASTWWSDPAYNDSAYAGDTLTLGSLQARFLIGGSVEVVDTFPPDNISGLTGTEVTATSIELDWTNPDSTDYTGVVFQARIDGVYPTAYNNGDRLLTHTVTTTSIDTATGLFADSTYHIRGFAYDAEATPNYAVAADTSDSVTVTLSANQTVVTVGERSTSDSTGYMWDFWIREGASRGVNYGTDTQLRCRTQADTTNNRYSFMYVDLSWLPALGTVTYDYCTLSVYTTYAPEAPTGDTLFVYELADSVVDTLATWESPVGDTTVSYWTNTGWGTTKHDSLGYWLGVTLGGADTIQYGYRLLSLVVGVETRIGIDLRAINRAVGDSVGAMPSGYMGLAIKDSIIGGVAQVFGSSDYGTASYRPELEIAYTYASGDATPPKPLTTFVATSAYSHADGDSVQLELGSCASSDADSLRVQYRTDGVYPTSRTNGTNAFALAYAANKDTTIAIDVADSTVVYCVAFVGDTADNWNAGNNDTAYILLPDVGDTTAPEPLNAFTATATYYEAGAGDSVLLAFGFSPTRTGDIESLLVEWDATAFPVDTGDGTQILKAPYAVGFDTTVSHAAGNGDVIYYTAWVTDTADNISSGVSDTALFQGTDTTAPAALNYFKVIAVNTGPDSVLIRIGESSSADADSIRIQAGVGAYPTGRADSTSVLAVTYAEYWDTTIAVTFPDSVDVYFSSFVGDDTPNWSTATFYWQNIGMRVDTNTVLLLKFDSTSLCDYAQIQTVATANIDWPADYSNGIIESDTTAGVLDASATEYITITDANEVDLDMDDCAGWSVEMILKKPDWGDDPNGMLVWKGPLAATGDTGWNIYTEKDTFRIEVGDGDSVVSCWPVLQSGISDSTDFHYVVVTIDTVAALGLLYVDGQQDGSMCDLSGLVWGQIDSPDDFFINHPSYLLNVTFDELRITREVIDSATVVARWAKRLEDAVRGTHDIDIFMPGLTYPDSTRGADPEFDSYKLKRHGPQAVSD